MTTDIENGPAGILESVQHAQELSSINLTTASSIKLAERESTEQRQR